MASEGQHGVYLYISFQNNATQVGAIWVKANTSLHPRSEGGAEYSIPLQMATILQN